MNRILAVWLLLSGVANAGESHWAFQPVLRPELQRDETIEFSDALLAWQANPVDRFIAAQLRVQGLRPNPPASREALIRRITLDLTGIPPTWEEVERFKADPAPNAYHRLVLRLLHSPRYGERMALPWLDLARYADTHGYHMDAHREMWRWRDGLIDALNQGMPYDQFTIEQLAGDLLPKATRAQQIATGFHRNHMINFEDGAIAEEYRTEYVADRVVTTGTVWLGLTLACCRCHDHRYDPLSQEDFFRLYAFFNDVPESGIDGDQGNAHPALSAPLPHQVKQLGKLESRIQSLQEKIAERELAVSEEAVAWATEASGRWRAVSFPEAAFHLTLDRNLPHLPNVTLHGTPRWARGERGEALLLDGSTHLELSGVLDQQAAMTFSAWVYPTIADEMTLFSKSRSGPHARGVRIELREGKLVFTLFNRPRGKQLQVETNGRMALNRWQHVVVVQDGAGRASGVQLFLDGRSCRQNILSDDLQQPVLSSATVTIGGPQSPFRGMMDDVRFFDRPLSQVEISALAEINSLGELLSVPANQRTPQHLQQISYFYLMNVDGEYPRLKKTLARLLREQSELKASIPSVMVMRSDRERETRVLENGRYDRPGDEVEAGTPAVLPPFSDELPRNRLGLARWIVDPRNPLTARVLVNRLWQHHFGRGLVATADDFGTEGALPTHPHLLDWLASELIDSRWDVRRIQYLIVTSATYQQSSRLSDSVREADPQNLWWARMARPPLPAELVRDSALAVSGLLVEKIGGPGVFPYQPEGLWKELSYDPDEFTAQVYVRSHGSDLYRRSLYTFWKRSVPPPNMEIFDAPSREQCVVTRPETTTPLQALVVMNDPTFVEAARALAARIMQRPYTLPDRLRFAYRAVIGRTPRQEELEVLDRLWHDQRRAFWGDESATERLLGFGELRSSIDLPPDELAAWTTVASVLFCTDAFLRRP